MSALGGSGVVSVFISWSKSSKKYGEALRHWLPLCGNVNTFHSNTDIANGDEWYKKINEELGSATYGIVCIAPDNINAPWLNYEAGALKARLKGVTPLLIGVRIEDLRAERHPLSNVNAVNADADGIFKILGAIDQQTNAPRREEHLREVFKNNWTGKWAQRFEEALQEASSAAPPATAAHTSAVRSENYAMNSVLFDSAEALLGAAISAEVLLPLGASARIGMIVVHPEAGIGKIVEVPNEKYVTVEIDGIHRTLLASKLRLAAFRSQ